MSCNFKMYLHIQQNVYFSLLVKTRKEKNKPKKKRFRTWNNWFLYLFSLCTWTACVRVCVALVTHIYTLDNSFGLKFCTLASIFFICLIHTRHKRRLFFLQENNFYGILFSLHFLSVWKNFFSTHSFLINVF